MTMRPDVVVDAEAETRWQDWRARGAESDRRTARAMRGVVLVITAAMLVWWVVQLA